MWSLPGRFRRPTLAGQFLLFQLAVVALVLAAVTAISIQQASTEARNELGSTTEPVAETLATTPVVYRQMVRLHAGRTRATDVARIVTPSLQRTLSLSQARSAYVVDPGGTVIASSDPTAVGERLELSDSDVLEGRVWTGELTDAGHASVASHVPMLSPQGELIGLTAVAVDSPSIAERLVGAVPDLLLFLGLGALLGVAGSWLLARLIKRRTRGLEPAEISTLADHREALLHSIREGVVGVSPAGRVTVLNDSARDLLDLPPEAVGRHVRDLDLPDLTRDLLLGREAGDDVVSVIGGRVLVLNRQAATSDGQSIGTVTTMRDRTELLAMRSQLSSTRSVTDALRAQTHEFANQLHTISGLVQLGEYEEVNRLIGSLTRRRAEINDAVTELVEDPPVAALLIAKTSSALESGVGLSLDPASRLPRLSGALSADVVTVLGNLVDNAVDAARSAGADRVEVLVEADEQRCRVVVRDHGPGVPDHLRGQIFERGFSTKSDTLGGRGLGLAIVQVVCAGRNGSVSVQDDRGPGAGAVFEAVLPYGEGDDD